MYVRRYTSPNDNFEYGYPHSNVLLQSLLKLKRCKPHRGICPPTKCDVINDVKLFLTVYCRKFMMLSNQKSHYKSKCIRILIIFLPISLSMSFVNAKELSYICISYVGVQHMVEVCMCIQRRFKSVCTSPQFDQS